MDENDHDRLTRLATVIEGLVDQTRILGNKLDVDIRNLAVSIDNDIQKLSKELHEHRKIEPRLAVAEDRIRRLNFFVFGCITAVGVELLGLIGGIVLWAVTRQPPH